MNNNHQKKITLTDLPAYKNLKKHFQQVSQLHMRRLFSVDHDRANKYSLSHKGLFLDYSKNRISNQTIPLLCELAKEVDLESWRERMFTGEQINNTEGKAVLHTALRNCSNTPIVVDGENIMPKINASIDKMEIFSKQVRSGEWRGYKGEKITDIVHIGFGGSDLGPKMVYEALKPYQKKSLTVHFISNVDGAHTNMVLENLKPEATLFIIASKSFTTQETLNNAELAREWFLQAAHEEKHISKHFVAVSSNRKEVTKFGIDPENIFEIWDWVVGRYSLWSTIGLSVVLSVGINNFKKMLKGAHSMDQHFREAPLEENMPVILGLLGIWYNNFFKAKSHGIFPYDYCLRSLIQYLEQTDMESNGKSVDRYGHKVTYVTGPVIWGTNGFNGQHAYYQSIHYGSIMIPADFIVSIKNHSTHQKQHDIIFANALAQTEALMRGRNYDETYSDIKASEIESYNIKNRINNMVFDGNHPSNTLLIDKLTPRSLGMLLALYEHKIFVQGIIWNLNSFDQWGVELGKRLTKNILRDINLTNDVTSHDGSTNLLINYYRKIAHAKNLSE